MHIYFPYNVYYIVHNIHSIFYHSLKENNHQWLSSYFQNLSEIIIFAQQQITEQQRIMAISIPINTQTLALNFPYNELLYANNDTKNVVFKYHQLNIVKPHMLVNEIFDDNQLNKLYELETLFNAHQITSPIKDIISKSLYANQINIAEYFFNKYPITFDKDATTDLINIVGLSGNMDSLNFLNQYILPLNQFNDEQKGILFNSGFITNRFDICEYLIKNKNFQFYPDSNELNKSFINIRHTMWEDKDDDILSLLPFLEKLKDLFLNNNWDINNLLNEIKEFDNSFSILNKILLNNKMNDYLSENNKPIIKKVKI